jgi:hypothetical protein
MKDTYSGHKVIPGGAHLSRGDDQFPANAQLF